jgi:outer membrane protein TolC
MKKVFIIIFIFSFLLVSCSQYTPDDVVLDVPNAWHVSNENYINADEDLVNLPWWQQFDDPTLNELIDKALLYNNDIQVAMANVEAAEGELKRVQLQWIPEADAIGGYSSWPDTGFPGVVFAIVPRYAVNIFKQIKEQDKAGYELEASESMRDGVRLAVIGQVAGSYFNYVSQIEQLALLTTLEKDFAQLADIAQNMHDGGLYAETEVDRAHAALQRIKAREKVVQQNIVISQNALHYLINEAPGELTTARTFNQLSGEHMIVGALPFNVIENRPDMQVAAQELAASNEDIGIAFSHLLPTIELRGAYGDIAKTPKGWDLGQFFAFNEFLLEVPVLKASVYGEIAKNKGLNKASYYRYTDTLLRVLRDVNNDLSAHDLYTKRLDYLLTAEQHTQKVFNFNNDLYQRGIISYLALIEERILLHELAIEVNQYKLDQFMTIVNLYQDLAVGYNYRPDADEEEDDDAEDI